MQIETYGIDDQWPSGPLLVVATDKDVEVEVPKAAIRRTMRDRGFDRIVIQTRWLHVLSAGEHVVRAFLRPNETRVWSPDDCP